MRRIIIKPEERISFTLHAAGAAMAAAGLIPLLASAGSAPERAVMAVYGLCVLLLFSASSLYHAKKREENEISLFRKLDHAAIFFMIAGTYTAICYLALDGAVRWTVIGLQWTLVLAGVLFRLFLPRTPRALYTAIYLAMGWVAAFFFRDLSRGMTDRAFLFLIAGGLAYTFGAAFYLAKRPRGRFGFHEIWHLFILVGAGMHYMTVYISV